MRQIIGIQIPREGVANLDTKLSEVSVLDILRFNSKEAHVIGATYGWDYDVYTIYLTHPEFPKIREGESVCKYYVEVAKRLYPYLFYDTNPLLYRKF